MDRPTRCMASAPAGWDDTVADAMRVNGAAALQFGAEQARASFRSPTDVKNALRHGDSGHTQYLE